MNNCLFNHKYKYKDEEVFVVEFIEVYAKYIIILRHYMECRKS